MPFHQIETEELLIKFLFLKMSMALQNRVNFSQIPCLKPATKIRKQAWLKLGS